MFRRSWPTQNGLHSLFCVLLYGYSLVGFMFCFDSYSLGVIFCVLGFGVLLLHWVWGAVLFLFYLLFIYLCMHACIYLFFCHSMCPEHRFPFLHSSQLTPALLIPPKSTPLFPFRTEQAFSGYWVCFLRKNLELGGREKEKMWNDLVERKNISKTYWSLKIILNNKNIIKTNKKENKLLINVFSELHFLLNPGIDNTKNKFLTELY